MEIMMEVTKDMCERINKRDDVFDEFFLEEGCQRVMRAYLE